jgi:hypothetical protein
MEIVDKQTLTSSGCVARRESLVEQELITLPEHLISPPVFSEVRVTINNG